MTPTELKQLRLALGWSQARLAQELGVHLMTVWRWEAGKVPISRAMSNLLKMLRPAQR